MRASLESSVCAQLPHSIDMGAQKREQGHHALTTHEGWNPQIGNRSDVLAVIVDPCAGGSGLELGYKGRFRPGRGGDGIGWDSTGLQGGTDQVPGSRGRSEKVASEELGGRMDGSRVVNDI